MCIKPLFGRFNDALRLIEFIEFYKLLGATNFVFYLQSVGESVMKVLKNYREKEEVTLMR